MKALVTLIVLLISATVFAQTPVVVPRGQTFAVEWTSHYPNDANVFRFQTFIDNALTKTWTTAELTATAAPLADCYGTTTPPTGATCFLYRGTHTALNNTGTRVLKMRVTEVASLLNSAFSPDVSFVVGTVPLAPLNPRIVVTTTQAGVVFEFKSVPVTVEASSPPQAMTTVRVPVVR